MELKATLKDRIVDIILENVKDLYWCGRVWTAWQDGTMTEDDFGEVKYLTTDIDNFADSIIKEIIK